jgi:hypothetical protein
MIIHKEPINAFETLSDSVEVSIYEIWNAARAKDMYGDS